MEKPPKFVPYDKASKKEQKRRNARRRGEQFRPGCAMDPDTLYRREQNKLVIDEGQQEYVEDDSNNDDEIFEDEEYEEDYDR